MPGVGFSASIRGEMILSKKNFKILNKDRLKEGLPLFVNPRNAAAGILRSNAGKGGSPYLKFLDFIAYQLVTPRLDTHKEGMDLLKHIGFQTTTGEAQCPE